MPATEETSVLTRKIFDPVETNFVPGERSMVAWISTDCVDHERDVVVSSGIDYKTYFLGKTPEEGNPCVLAFHDLGRWPLGRCEWIKSKNSREFNGLYAKTLFDDDPETESVWRKIKSRSLRGISIGFRPPDDLKPGEWGPPTREELLRRPDWKKAERIIRRCVLLEYSVCSLPMNPQALVAVVNKGVHRPVYSLPSPSKAKAMNDSDYKAMVQAACKVAKTIKHCGDYGTLFAHKEDAALHWTMADGDGGDGLDTSKMIEEKLGTVPGCKKVQIGDEWSPREEEGWERIHPPRSKSASVSRFDLAAKAVDGDDGIAASEVTPADARVMIGLAVPADVAASLAIEGGEPAEELHVTLCYLGRAIEVGTNAISRIEGMCRSLASWGPSLRGSVNGVGRFSASTTSDGQDVIYASVDIPALSSFRECLAREVQCQSVQYSRAHGFTPHITLAYVAPDAENPVLRITPTPVEFNALSLWVDGERTDFPINADGFAFGGPVMAWRSVADRLTKAMTDGASESDNDKACTCGKADCAKCGGKDGMATKEEEAEEATAEPDPDDFDEDDEASLPIKTGDHVDVKARGFKGCGVVEKIHRKGLVDHVDEDMVGTKDDPAARVRLYRAYGDGHVASGQKRACRLKELSRREERFKEPSKAKSVPQTATKNSPMGETPEPLPVVTVKSDQEVRAELIAKLNHMLSPEGFRRIAREEAERAAGFV